MDTRIFEERESNVRSYCRVFPKVFQRAAGAHLYAETGESYIDFFAGAGALNYGHNNPYIKQRLLAYIESDGVMQGLDMYTTVKKEFLETLTNFILTPRNLHYKAMFCGPTGADAVEAAIKLARKIKQRSNIFSFVGGYHGHSLGSLALTGNKYHRQAGGISLQNVNFMPYPLDNVNHVDTIDYIEKLLDDPYSGVETPAAIIFETVQAEGGVMVAPVQWIQHLKRLCDHYGILLICDDIQAGCWRTGTFFSFERAEVIPDMVTLSKSISGYGQPMSLLLLNAEHDIWQPAEHTGTFRGNQLAFVGATAALEYAHQQNISDLVREREVLLEDYLLKKIAPLHSQIAIRGLGMIWGIDFSQMDEGGFAQRVAAACFDQGLIIECVGRNNTVLKLLPPLTISIELLEQGCDVIKQCIESCLQNSANMEA